jgi:hypothetical protein
MHQLLGDAPHVDAGAAESPRRPDRRGLHKIAKADLLAEDGGLFGGRKAPGTTADNLW